MILRAMSKIRAHRMDGKVTVYKSMEQLSGSSAPYTTTASNEIIQSNSFWHLSNPSNPSTLACHPPATHLPEVVVAKACGTFNLASNLDKFCLPATTIKGHGWGEATL